MAQRFKKPWRLGDTGTELVFDAVDDDGALRTDLATGTLKLVNAASGTVLVNDEAMTQSPDGTFVYRFTAADYVLITAALSFRCRLKAIDDDGKTQIFEDVAGEFIADL
jgi:hypothetical protein